jgi:hypothetical protein
MFFGCLPCCGGGCPSYQDILAAETPTVNYTISIEDSRTGFSEYLRTYGITSSTVQNIFQTLPGINTSFEPYQYRVRVTPGSAGLSPLLSSFGIANTLESALIVSLDVEISTWLSSFDLFVIPCGSVHQVGGRTLLHGARCTVIQTAFRSSLVTPTQLTASYTTGYGSHSVTRSSDHKGYYYPHITAASGDDFGLAIGSGAWPTPLAEISTDFTIGPIGLGTYHQEMTFQLNGISSPIGSYYPPPSSSGFEVVSASVAI